MVPKRYKFVVFVVGATTAAAPPPPPLPPPPHPERIIEPSDTSKAVTLNVVIRLNFFIVISPGRMFFLVPPGSKGANIAFRNW
jgi:hypothetical protein